MGSDNYFEDKESTNTLYIVFNLVKESFREGKISERTIYSIINLVSYYYFDNFNVKEFVRFLHTPQYSTREHIIYPKNDGFLNKHLIFLFLIPLKNISYFSDIAEKLIEKEVIKIILRLNRDRNDERVLEFVKILQFSLSHHHSFKRFYKTIFKSYPNQKLPLFAEFFVDFLIEKKLPNLSILELKNKLNDTQKSLRAYLISKGLLELRYQKSFYFT